MALCLPQAYNKCTQQPDPKYAMDNLAHTLFLCDAGASDNPTKAGSDTIHLIQ